MTTLRTIIAALLLATSACAQTYLNQDATIVIPRQSATVQTPGPWQMNDKSQPQRPGGLLAGKGVTQTVYVFDPSVKDALIKTEGFGTGKVGRYWNQNNTDGDKSLKCNLLSIARDFTVDGRAEFRPYPMGPAPGWPQPPAKDIHGQDYPWRADGVCMQGSGNRAERLRLFNIPGTGLVIRSGAGSQAGFYGLWDECYTIVDDVRVTQAINGVDIAITDAKLSRLWVDNVAKEGAILDLNGGYLNTDHICGADVGCRIKSEIHATDCYHESARIGTIIEAGAHGCDFKGLNIGPGTCTEFGVQVFSNNNDIDCSGGVRKGAVGLLDAGHSNTTKAKFYIADGGVGARIQGNASELNLRTVQLAGGTALEVVGPINGWEIKLRIQGYNNPVALNVTKMTGTGNVFRIVSLGDKLSMKNVVGVLPPGNELWVDGVLQK